MDDIDVFLALGVTRKSFQTLNQAAKIIVDSGEPESVYFVLFNQVDSLCAAYALNSSIIFEGIIEHLKKRLEDPDSLAGFLDR